MQVQLKSLINRLIKTSLTRFKKFFEESRESAMFMEIIERYEKYSSLYDKYINIQKSIEETVKKIKLESTHAAHLVAYFDIMSTIKDFIENARAQKREKSVPSLGSNTPLSHSSFGQFCLK